MHQATFYNEFSQNLTKVLLQMGTQDGLLGGQMLITDDIKELISKGYRQSEFDAELKKQNFITLRQDTLVKAAKGLISLEEVFGVTQL